MEQQTKFRKVNTRDARIQFIGNDIIITVDHCFYENGKHQITDPKSANAQFTCLGKRYSVANTDGISTVEDWYLHELLPKYQMLTLLMTDQEI